MWSLSNIRYLAPHSMALSPEDNPRLLWFALESFDAYGVGYSICNENCSDASGWTHQKLVTGSTGFGATQILVDSDGDAYFAYSGGPSNGTTYYHCEDSDCTTAGASQIEFENRLIYALALSNTDMPRFASLNATGSIQYGSCDGSCSEETAWRFQNVDYVSMEDMMAPAMDLTIDPSNFPLVAYANGGELKLAISSEAPPPWGAASVAGITSSPAEKIIIFMLMLVLPMGMLFLLRVRKKKC